MNQRCMAILIPSLALPLSAAQAQTGPSFVDITFDGTVTQAADETIVARNPGGGTTTLTGDQIPAYRYNPGDSLTTTFRFITDQPALADPSCGGRFAVDFAQQSGGRSCFVELAFVSTPFGRAGFGGTGGDSPPSITGLELVRNDATGAYALDLPTGSYQLRYVGVNPYYYNSSTGELLPPNNNPCVDAFNCPQGIITGTATGWTSNIPIAGNFGQVRPGTNVGYDAGSAGTFTVSGLFSSIFGGSSGGGSSGGATDVPGPAMPALFLLGVAGLALRQRRRGKPAL